MKVHHTVLGRLLFLIYSFLFLVTASSASIGGLFANINEIKPGSKITIGQNNCTIGFFGSNSSGDHFFVTAGHCSESANQIAYNANKSRIGVVVSHLDDEFYGDVYAARGYTLVKVDNNVKISPYFRRVSAVEIGQTITVSGAKSGNVQGKVTDIYREPSNPRYDLAFMNVHLRPGDSGAPVITDLDARTLIGIETSGSEGNNSQYQPIDSVINLVRTYGSVWGDNFSVWTE